MIWQSRIMYFICLLSVGASGCSMTPRYKEAYYKDRALNSDNVKSAARNSTDIMSFIKTVLNDKYKITDNGNELILDVSRETGNKVHEYNKINDFMEYYCSEKKGVLYEWKSPSDYHLTCEIDGKLDSTISHLYAPTGQQALPYILTEAVWDKNKFGLYNESHKYSYYKSSNGNITIQSNALYKNVTLIQLSYQNTASKPKEISLANTSLYYDGKQYDVDFFTYDDNFRKVPLSNAVRINPDQWLNFKIYASVGGLNLGKLDMGKLVIDIDGIRCDGFVNTLYYENGKKVKKASF